MLHKLFSYLDTVLSVETVEAHCDVPCGIYDPSTAQLAALSTIRFIDLILELNDGDLSRADQVKLSRLTLEKEAHAEKVKNEVRIIWGDYFKAPQLEQCPGTHELVHEIMIVGSKCKQGIDRANGEALLELVNTLAESFWKTKGKDTYRATSPYKPECEVVYPKLG